MGAQRTERDWMETEEQTTKNPWNLMIKHRQVQRRGRRSHMTVRSVFKGTYFSPKQSEVPPETKNTNSYTDPVISMDLLRAVIQPSFNQDIMNVYKKYLQFFEKAAENVKENVGDEVHTDHLIKDTCRNLLEHAKQLFPEPETKISRPPDIGVKRAKQTDEDSQRGSPVPKKRKGRPAGQTASHDRTTFTTPAKPKASESVKREGPKWDPSRLIDSSTFVLGSRANKALGMGGTRGRIYIKHADLFKYAADAQDKHWLAEGQHMRATGGKMAYLLIEEDIQDLFRTDEYKDCPELKTEELKPFSVPPWMVDKMRKTMEAQRSENALCKEEKEEKLCTTASSAENSFTVQNA